MRLCTARARCRPPPSPPPPPPLPACFTCESSATIVSGLTDDCNQDAPAIVTNYCTQPQELGLEPLTCDETQYVDSQCYIECQYITGDSATTVVAIVSQPGDVEGICTTSSLRLRLNFPAQ